MPGPRWRRELEEAFTERLGYKAAALALAIVLWLVANAEEREARLEAARGATAPRVDSAAVSRR